jgi:hypothetical protein
MCVLLQNPTALQQEDTIRVQSVLLGVWYIASTLALYGSDPNKDNLIISNMWRQLPALARALPTVAEVMHMYLQHPVSRRREAHHDELYITSLVQQLQLMMDHGVAATGHHTSSSSSSGGGAGSASRASSSTATRISGPTQQQGRPTCVLLDEALFPPAARAKVRGGHYTLHPVCCL